MIKSIQPKKADLGDVFGALKGKLEMSGQEFKDFVREGWLISDEKMEEHLKNKKVLKI